MSDFSISGWIQGGNKSLSEVTGRNSFEKVLFIYALISKIAQTVSTVKKTIKKDGEIIPETEKDDPVIRLFNPPWGITIPTFEDLIEGLTTLAYLDGDSFLIPDNFIKEGDKKVPTVIKLVPGNRVKAITNAKDGIEAWQFKIGNKKVTLKSSQIAQFKLFSNPYKVGRGITPLTASRSAIENYVYSDAFNASIMQTGEMPTTIIETSENLTAEQRAQLKRNYNSYRKGLEKGSSVLIIEGGAKYIQSKISTKDIQYIEGKKMSREELCSIFNVPPAIMSIFEYANYANAEAQERYFYSSTVLPLLHKIQATIQNQILDLLFPGYTFEFDLTDIMPIILSLKEKVDVATKFFNMGVPFNTINKVMRLGFPELEGGEYGYLNGMPITMEKEKSKMLEREIKKTNIEVEKKNKFSFLNMYKNGKKIDTSDNFFMVYSRLVNSIYKPYIEKVERFYIEYFTQLEKLIIRDLNKLDENNAIGTYKFNSDKYGLIYEEMLYPTVENISVEALYVLVGEISSKNLTARFMDFAKKEIPENLTLENFLTAEQVKLMHKQIGDNLNRASLTVTQTYSREIDKAVKEGVQEGKTINQIADDIKEVTNKQVTNALLNAQTLVTASYNGARMVGYESYNIKEHLWISMRDGNVRESHQLEDNGIPVRVGQPFPYTGLRYPGDYIGSASEVCNCRCTTIAMTSNALTGLEPTF